MLEYLFKENNHISMFTPVTTDRFEHYFYKQAQCADELVASGNLTVAYTLVASLLDALAEIWLQDFPDTKKKLEQELGGTPPSSIRLARFLKEFIPNDPDITKVAVICFAEDWKHYRPQDSHIANQLLSERINQNPIFAKYEFPRAYLDKPRKELAIECPELAARPDLLALAEEYEYGSLVYSFYRCPLIHYATNSERTNDIARGEEVMYYPSSDDRIAISFGFNLITRWLCNAVSGYVQACHHAGIVTANNINAGASQEKRFKGLWSKIK